VILPELEAHAAIQVLAFSFANQPIDELIRLAVGRAVLVPPIPVWQYDNQDHDHSQTGDESNREDD
jgi:hypothetical protein